MHPRDASASKKERNICSVEEEWKGEIFDPKRYFVVTEKEEEENIWKQDLQQWKILSHASYTYTCKKSWPAAHWVWGLASPLWPLWISVRCPIICVRYKYKISLIQHTNTSKEICWAQSIGNILGVRTPRLQGSRPHTVEERSAAEKQVSKRKGKTFSIMEMTKMENLNK